MNEFSVPATNSKEYTILRKAFEEKAQCAWGFKKSAKGNYQNPVTANRWKWFFLGYIQAQEMEV